jgi:arginase family enzyme
MGDVGLEPVDGVEAKAVLIEQLARALELIAEHDPERILTLGGECAVSVAPFSTLARRYGDDLAMLWIDSHLDIGTPASAYPGIHAMAVAARRRPARCRAARPADSAAGRQVAHPEGRRFRHGLLAVSPGRRVGQAAG